MIKKLFSLLLILFCTNTHAGDTLDRIVAVVNDTPVMESELNHFTEVTKQQVMASGGSLPAETQLHKQMLEQLVDKKLQLQLAEQNNLNVSDSEIDQAIKNIAENNKFTIDELYLKIAEQGITKDDYRKEIRE